MTPSISCDRELAKLTMATGLPYSESWRQPGDAHMIPNFETITAVLPAAPIDVLPSPARYSLLPCQGDCGRRWHSRFGHRPLQSDWVRHRGRWRYRERPGAASRRAAELQLRRRISEDVMAESFHRLPYRPPAANRRQDQVVAIIVRDWLGKCGNFVSWFGNVSSRVLIADVLIFGELPETQGIPRAQRERPLPP